MAAPAASGATGTARPVGTSEHLLRCALWFMQASLGGVFAWAGWTKLVNLGANLTASLPWTIDVPVALVRVIGACELIGAIGLVVPAATRVRPHLTAVAASCLTALMALAVMFHLYRGDAKIVLVPTVLGAASAFVAWGRFRKLPIDPR